MKNPKKSRSPNPSARKRTFHQRDKELVKIGEYYLQGFSQYEIAEKMGLSQPQISRDLKEYAKRIAPEEETDKAKLRQRWMDKNNLMQKKLWLSFEKSTEDKEIQTKKQIESPGGDAGEAKDRIEAFIRSEGQCGNPSYMSELGKCLEREAKMLDLYPAKKIEHSGADGDAIPITLVEVVRPYAKGSPPGSKDDSGNSEPARVVTAAPPGAPLPGCTTPDNPSVPPIPPVSLTAAQQEELEIAARAKEPPVRYQKIGAIDVEIHLSERDEVKLDRALAQWAQEIAAQKFKQNPPRYRGKDV